jgi:hypothetical protein
MKLTLFYFYWQKESLRTGLEMRQAVKLPNGEDRNEWIAMNTIEQFNTLTMVYDIIADFCTVKSCPLMSAASPKGEYVFSIVPLHFPNSSDNEENDN